MLQLKYIKGCRYLNQKLFSIPLQIPSGSRIYDFSSIQIKLQYINPPFKSNKIRNVYKLALAFAQHLLLVCNTIQLKGLLIIVPIKIAVGIIVRSLVLGSRDYALVHIRNSRIVEGLQHQNYNQYCRPSFRIITINHLLTQLAYHEYHVPCYALRVDRQL